MSATPDTIRVLHVDDEPGFAEMTADFLEREDDRFVIEIATSPSAGLEYLAERDFDCVVSDYDMPGQNGIEFLRDVREDDPYLPCILFTGKGSEEIASDAISAGVTDYLQKESGTSQYTVLANRITNSVEQYRARLEQQRRRERQDRQWDALLELTTDDAVTAGDFWTALKEITETAADVLEVPRVNVWLFDDQRETLRCVDHFDRPSNAHETDMELVAENYPAYFQALTSNRSIDVADAFEDPRTAELTEYLEKHDVRALLDATIRSEGEVVGVVCHEHVGATREWTDDEIQFASDIADLVHRAFQNRERVKRTYELERNQARFKALTENTTHAVVTIDGGSTIRYANDAVEDVFGYAPEELVGGSLLTIIPGRCQDDHQEALDRYLREGTKRLDWSWVELPGLHRDGHEIPLGISFGEATVGGEPRFTAIIRNIEQRKQREHELEAVQRRFETVFNSPVAFMGLLEPDGTVIDVNQTALEFVDRSLGDVRGKPFWETPWWTHSERLQNDLRSWIEQTAAGELVRFESDHYAPDGEKVTIDGILHPIRDGEGTVTSILVAGRDISDRKDYEYAINALHGATRELFAADSVDEIADMLLETASDLLDLPHTGVHLHEEDANALVPVTWSDAVVETIGEPPPALGRDSLAWDVFEDGEARVYDDLTTHQDVSNPDTPLRSELIAPLGRYGIVITAAESQKAFDQNDRRLIELLCENAATALDRVTRERLLRDRERELERQNERLAEFAGIVSHDLRNPLSVADGYLELVREDCDSEHLESIDNALDRIDRIIEDVLWLARKGRDIGDTEPIDIHEITTDAWSIAADGHDGAELVVEDVGSDGPGRIEADGDRLQQLLENLIRNAVEHGGEPLTVTVGGLDDGFYIEDTGPGIPAEERDNVFEAGYSTSDDGAGFGLSIVRQVVEAHGWEIRDRRLRGRCPVRDHRRRVRRMTAELSEHSTELSDLARVVPRRGSRESRSGGRAHF